MIGSWVEVKTSVCGWCEGEVVSTNEEEGTVTIKTDEGDTLVGCESQVVTIRRSSQTRRDKAHKQPQTDL